MKAMTDAPAPPADGKTFPPFLRYEAVADTSASGWVAAPPQGTRRLPPPAAASLSSGGRRPRATASATPATSPSASSKGLAPIRGYASLSTSSVATAPAAAADGENASTAAAPKEEPPQHHRDALAPLMRAVTQPSAFLGQVLDTLFPPRVAAAAAPTTTTGAAAAASGGSSSGRLRGLRPARQRLRVSRAPVKREDVALLHDALRLRLQERRAMPTGVCPIRREIYTDVFCELVRQVTIEEPARGVLLQRLKEESEHSLLVHADLLAGAHFFAARKVLESPQGVGELRARLEELQEETQALERRRQALLARRDELEQKFDEEKVARGKAQQEELSYLRRTNQQLSLRLKAETERTSPAAAAGANGGEGGGAAGAAE